MVRLLSRSFRGADLVRLTTYSPIPSMSNETVGAAWLVINPNVIGDDVSD